MDKKKREQLIKALANVSGFDLEMAMYRNAGSFEEAIDLFFERFIANLKAANRIVKRFEVSSDVVDMRERVEDEIKIFLARVYEDVFIVAIQQYIDIVEHYQNPKTEKQNAALQEAMKKYTQDLDKELKDVSTRAKQLLKKIQEIQYHQSGCFETVGVPIRDDNF